MRRTGALLLAALVLVACGGGHSAATPTTRSSTIPAPTSASTSSTSTTVSTTTTLPTGWTKRTLLAQLIMVGAQFADPGASADVIRAGAGGLVFFGAPAAGSGAELTTQLSALTRLAAVTPLMSTDEEGGGIARLSNVVGPLPWPRQMAAQWSPVQLREHLTTVASAMRALGINMDLAPVVDTASSTDSIDEENLRSFSAFGTSVVSYGFAYLQGLEDGGVIGVFKHFPGLGHANGDTDTGSAMDPALVDLSAEDLVPFLQAVRKGAPAMMMSNVTEPDWGATPASLNPRAYAYLRSRGYRGMILTDSLDAGAISATGTNGAQAVVDSIEAGADMAMITSASEFPGALAGLETAVSTGHLSMAQVVASVDRIIEVKHAIPSARGIAPPN